MPENSNEINEIIEKQPPWLMRYGIMSLFFMLIILIVIAAFIKYPDRIISKVIIVTENPPIEVVSHQSRQIQLLFYTEGQHVKKGSWIVYLSNSVNFNEIVSLKYRLDSISGKTFDFENIGKNPIPFSKNLGELQTYFNQLYQFQESIIAYQKIQSYPIKSRNVFQKLKHQSKQEKTINQQYELNIKDFELLELHVKRNRELYSKGVISLHDLEIEERNYMKKKFDLNQSLQNINNAKLLTNQVVRENIDLKISDEETKIQFIQNYNNSFNELKAKIDLWISENVIQSPIDGEIVYFDKLETGQFLILGQKLAAIIPHKKRAIVGKGYFPIQNSGKVKIGCKVNLKFDAFSFKEYGIVDGVVSKISKIPLDGMYMYTLKLPDKLNTKYKDKIDFKQKTTATGEIITEDLSFLQRILHQFKNLYLN